MKRAWVPALLLFALTAASCGSDDDGGANSGGSGGAAGSGATAGSGGASGSGNAAGSAGSAGSGNAPGSPECPAGITADPDVNQALPQATVDSAYVAPSGQVHTVAAGGDLQAAIDAAQPGDEIRLESGATFTGTFTLRNKSSDGYIVIRSDVADGELPAPGTRIDPSYGSKLAKIVAPANVSAIDTEAGAHHWRVIGLEISPEPGAFAYNVIDLGSGAAALADLPHHIVIDRCWVHGDPALGSRRGVGLNSAATAIVDSWFSDFKEVGADSQAIAGWAGTGPYKITNNHLEGAGENVIFGGADPQIADVVPSDIEICKNHFFKPPAWQNENWSVKNVFELKNARRVLLAGNVLDYNWADAQVGFAVVLTPRNQDGSAPWSTIEDVTITLNVVRHTASAFNLLGEDDNHPSQQQSRVVIADNFIDDVSPTQWGGDGRVFQVITPNAPALAIKIDHNTATSATNAFLTMGDTTTVADGFWFTNNLVPKGNYGAFGSGQGEGNTALDFYLDNYVFAKNVIVGASSSNYPAENFFPATLDDVGFVDHAGGDWSLSASSPYKAAGSDGRDPGANLSAVLAATAGVAP
jgi:hypothetical protein